MPNAKCKYPTYKSLADAFRSGELDPKKFVLRLDNDNSGLTRIDIDPEADDASRQLEMEAESLFEGYGCDHEDVLEILAVAGIPSESV